MAKNCGKLQTWIRSSYETGRSGIYKYRSGRVANFFDLTNDAFFNQPEMHAIKKVVKHIYEGWFLYSLFVIHYIPLYTIIDQFMSYQTKMYGM